MISTGPRARKTDITDVSCNPQMFPHLKILDDPGCRLRMGAVAIETIFLANWRKYGSQDHKEKGPRTFLGQETQKSSVRGVKAKRPPSRTAAQGRLCSSPAILGV